MSVQAPAPTFIDQAQAFGSALIENTVKFTKDFSGHVKTVVNIIMSFVGSIFTQISTFVKANASKESAIIFVAGGAICTLAFAIFINCFGAKNAVESSATSTQTA